MDEAGRLALYPVIMAFAYIPASVDRVQNMIAPTAPIYSLQMVHIVTVGLCGGLNAVAFLTTPSVRRELRLFFVRWHCLKAPKELSNDLERIAISMQTLEEPLVDPAVAVRK
jgi:hypothetical protein